jgi:hypothetical protein
LVTSGTCAARRSGVRDEPAALSLEGLASSGDTARGFFPGWAVEVSEEPGRCFAGSVCSGREPRADEASEFLSELFSWIFGVAGRGLLAGSDLGTGLVSPGEVDPLEGRELPLGLLAGGGALRGAGLDFDGFFDLVSSRSLAPPRLVMTKARIKAWENLKGFIIPEVGGYLRKDILPAARPVVPPWLQNPMNSRWV